MKRAGKITFTVFMCLFFWGGIVMMLVGRLCSLSTSRPPYCRPVTRASAIGITVVGVVCLVVSTVASTVLVVKWCRIKLRGIDQLPTV